MKLINKKTKKILIEKIKIAETPWGKLRGLMFETKENYDYGLVFDFGDEHQAMASIHMMFVFFPIDLVYLNNKKQVVDLKRKIAPFTPNYTPKKRARYLIEMPENSTKQIKLGDELDWE